jgi:hypothetical protein
MRCSSCRRHPEDGRPAWRLRPRSYEAAGSVIRSRGERSGARRTAGADRHDCPEHGLDAPAKQKPARWPRGAELLHEQRHRRDEQQGKAVVTAHESSVVRAARPPRAPEAPGRARGARAGCLPDGGRRRRYGAWHERPDGPGRARSAVRRRRPLPSTGGRFRRRWQSRGRRQRWRGTAAVHESWASGAGDGLTTIGGQQHRCVPRRPREGRTGGRDGESDGYVDPAPGARGQGSELEDQEEGN